VNEISQVSHTCDYFDQLTVAVEEIGRLRWIVGQLIMLAADASNRTDHELRDSLKVLAGHSGRYETWSLAHGWRVPAAVNELRDRYLRGWDQQGEALHEQG
jgi:hypothetical protein